MKVARLYSAPGTVPCCGNQLADTVAHFVPKARCALRTFHWPNLLLSCSTCNTRFKGDKHESDGLLGALLIDPTREDPFEHLDLRLKSGVYRAVDGSKKGTWTIEVCGLNRKGRPWARVKAWVNIGGHLRAWDRARDDHDERGMRFAEHCIAEQPFADVYHAALRQADSEHAERIFVVPGRVRRMRDSNS